MYEIFNIPYDSGVNFMFELVAFESLKFNCTDTVPWKLVFCRCTNSAVTCEGQKNRIPGRLSFFRAGRHTME